MAVLARWCVRHRLLTVLVWLLALAGTASAAAATTASYTNDYNVPGTESQQAAELLAERFPDAAGEYDTLVWHVGRGSSVRDADVEKAMSHTLRRIAEQDVVASVAGPYSGRGSGQISPDSRTAWARITYGVPVHRLHADQVRAVTELAEQARTDGLQVETGGSATALTRTQGGHTAEFVGVAVAVVVLFLAFGSVAAALLPVATALVSVGTAAACVELLGHVMSVADFAPMLGMLVGLGVGIDYALFVVTRHRRGLLQGLDPDKAAVDAVVTTGRAVVFAGATVCIALLGMLILRLDFLNGVAVAASLTVALTVAASVTLLPALLSLIGTRALGLRARRRLTGRHALSPGGELVQGPGQGVQAPARALERGEGPQELPTEPPLGRSAAEAGAVHPKGPAARWSALVERRPLLLGALAVALMALLTVPAFQLRLGTSDQGSDPASSTTRAAYDLLAEGFGAGVNGPFTLVAEVDDAADRLAMDQLGHSLAATDGVAWVSPVTYDAAGDAGFWTVVPETGPQSTATSELVDRLRDEVLPRAEAGTSLDVLVGGVTAGYDDFADVILAELPLFVGAVVGLGCLLLLLAFRSVGIPLKAAVMNIAAVSAAFGVVVAVFQFGWGSEALGLGSAGPIEPFLPVIMVAVLFGLSMDYQVFLLSRMYEEWLATRDNRRAVRVGLAETSRVINSAAVIMIAVFLAFVLSGDRVVAMFGIGLAAAVALDAFVLRTLLVPALMHLLGGANWWLPARLDRILPRISIEAPQPVEQDGPVRAPAEPELVRQR